MTDDSKPLTNVSFIAFEKTVDALEAAADMTGDSPTDVLNRAVQLYAEVLRIDCGGLGSGRVVFDSPASQVRIEVNRPWWRFW